MNTERIDNRDRTSGGKKVEGGVSESLASFLVCCTCGTQMERDAQGAERQ